MLPLVNDGMQKSIEVYLSVFTDPSLRADLRAQAKLEANRANGPQVPALPSLAENPIYTALTSFKANAPDAQLQLTAIFGFLLDGCTITGLSLDNRISAK
jgi:hypothetical protein